MKGLIWGFEKGVYFKMNSGFAGSKFFSSEGPAEGAAAWAFERVCSRVASILSVARKPMDNNHNAWKTNNFIYCIFDWFDWLAATPVRIFSKAHAAG